MTRTFWRWVLTTFALSVACLASFSARADVPTIEPGRETDVLALLAPYRPGAEITAGWKVWDVAIQPNHIEVGLRDPADRTLSFSLVHPTQAESNARLSPSFAVKWKQPIDGPQERAARDALLEAIRRNDDGKFWRVWRPISTRAGTEIPVPFGRSLVSDGLLLSVVGALLALALALHVLASSPLFVRVGLPIITAAGIALRLELSPVGFLGAWPWSRLWPNVRIIWESPLFGNLAEHLGKEIFLTDLMLWVNFGYACLMPVVLFAHASQLLRDSRAGFAAAAIVAFSPHHIRFSRCEDAFVPSLVLTSLAFALLHTFMRDPSRRWRWLALAALPFVLWPGYLLRPLNIMFIVVYLGAIVLLHPHYTPVKRRVAAALVVVGVGIAAIFQFVQVYSNEIIDATTSPTWVLLVPTALFSPSLNMLIHPLATAPALLMFAAFGVQRLVNRGERQLALFLLGWLAIYFVAHASVLAEPMQPRYHLHLLVPFTMLASTGIVASFHWVRTGTRFNVRRTFGLGIGLVTVACAPWFGKRWVTDTGYTDMLEYAFVRQARDVIPEGCTVIEYIRPDAEHNSRFRRIGQRLAAGKFGDRFTTVFARLASADAKGMTALDATTQKELSRGADACVYIYEGLGCWSDTVPSESYAQACTALVQAAPLETVMEQSIPFRPYDVNVTRGVRPGTQQLRLALSRVVPRPKVADLP